MKRESVFSDIGKVPPHASELEAAVIGGIILDSEKLDSIEAYIGKHSFYIPEHQKVFDVLTELKQKEKLINLLTVTQELKDKGELDSIGGPMFITGLIQNVSSATDVERYARIVVEKFFKRKMIEYADLLKKSVYEEDDVELLGKMWNTFGNELDDIFTIANHGAHIKTVLADTVEEIEQDCVMRKENKIIGVPTGIKEFDEVVGGFRNGNLNVIAARPGMGKTSIALYTAINAARTGSWVNFFSLEMSKEDLARILLAAESGIYRSNIRDGELTDEDWKKINEAIGRLEKLPIIFRDSSGMNADQIKAVIHKNHKNGRCDIAFVDYLQLVDSVQKKAIRELEVSEISRTLKTTALTEGIPIVALSQLNREADGKEPQLRHIRESGAIEQDADLVCFLIRHNEQGVIDMQGDIIRLIIAKHRRGKLGEIEIFHNGEMTRFSDKPM